MAISEATAMARAKAQKAAFPKGKTTEAQAIDMFVAMANSQVGYASGTATNSMYAKRSNWPDGTWVGSAQVQPAYWCYQGISWTSAMCFGRAATIAGFGNQGFPHPGWLATWLGMAWMRGQGLQVPLASCRKGDIVFQRWGRTSNPADHVEIVTGRWNGWNYPATGFNTYSGGSGGDPSTGATVAQVWRPSGPTVAVCRPNWKALVAAYNAGVDDVIEVIYELTKPIIQALEDCGFEGSAAGVKAFQRYVGIKADGIPGPTTQKELKREVSEIKETLRANFKQTRWNRDRLEALKNQIAASATVTKNNNTHLNNQNEVLSAIAVAIGKVDGGGLTAEQLLDYRLEFAPHTSVGDLWPNGLKVRSALAYASAAMKHLEADYPDGVPTPPKGPHAEGDV